MSVRRRRSAGRAAATATVAAVALAGCGASNLAFRTDHRVHISSPASRALVDAPVTLRWNLLPRPEAPTTFAVFVDRAPVKPGQTLRAVAAGDSSCQHAPGCPDAQYLADRQVYTTTDTSLTLQTVGSLNSYQTTQLHEATIVLLDASGRRVGEAAWYVDFRMRHRRFR